MEAFFLSYITSVLLILTSIYVMHVLAYIISFPYTWSW